MAYMSQTHDQQFLWYPIQPYFNLIFLLKFVFSVEATLLIVVTSEKFAIRRTLYEKWTCMHF